MIKKNLPFALLLLVLASWLTLAGSLTYSQDGTPIVSVGTPAAGTNINNINADDALYYIINAVPTSNTTAVLNPNMNGNVNSWTSGTEYTAPGSNNAWTYDTATYVSSPGSGQLYIRPDASQDNIWVAGTAYQAPTTTVDSTTTNYLNWSMKYDSLSNTGNVQVAAICAEVYGTIGGTAGRQLYYCYFRLGSAPADTANIKYITLGSGTSTAWQSFSRNIGADIDSKWGASTAYTVSEVRVVDLMQTGTIPNNAGRPAFYAHYDDIYLLKGANYQEDVRHKSVAGVAVPSGHTLMRIVASDKFYSSSATPTYQLQWWNTNTAGWDNCGAAAAQNVEGTRACDTSTNPSYYINAADSNKVLARLYSSTTAAGHSLNENYLYYKIWFPNLTSTTISPASDPTPYANDTFQVNCTSSVDADYGIANAAYNLYYSTDGGTNYNLVTTSSSNLKLDASTPTNPYTAQSISAGGSTTKSWTVNGTSVGTVLVKCATTSVSAGAQNATPLTVTILARPVTSATLTAPAADPDINTGQTFTLSVQVSCSTGACANVVVYPRYCTGSPCTPNADITTVTSGLTSNANSVSLGTVNAGSPQTASFTITGAANNTYVVGGRFTSTPNSGDATGTQTVSVKSPAALTATITATPASVADGATITVNMTVTNTGQRAANTVAPSALTVATTGTASAALATGPSPVSATISGGASQSYIWNYTASGGISGGTVTFNGTASGTDAKTGGAVTSNNAASGAVTIAAKFVTATLTAPVADPDINTGQTFTLSVQATCSSGACANVVVYPRYCNTSLACTPNADITTATTDLTSNANSVSLGTVTAGAPQTANFTITGTLDGNYTVGGRFTSTPNNGNATGTQGVSVKSPAALTATITASPNNVTDGENITVTMTVSNTGTRAAVNVTPSALTVNIINGTASASLLTGPSPSIANITGLGSQNFTWTYNASSGTDGGNITFSGNASGKDNKTGATVNSNNATSNAVEVRLKGTNLTIWDETDANLPYANMSKYGGDAVAFFANYTRSSDNASLSGATCRIAIFDGTNWTAWANMTWNATRSFFQHNYTAGFACNGTYAWNVTCNQTSYQSKSANDTAAISVRPASLLIWSDTNTTTKYPNDQVYFFANYTLANGTIIDASGVCQISFNITGGWTAWANMTYNTSSTPYYYNRSFTQNGTFNFNVTCSKACYQSRTANSTFVITPPVPVVTVTTGKASYSGCAKVYYRVRLYDANGFLHSASFDLAAIDSASATRMSQAGLYPNNGTGIYTGILGVNSSGPAGSWLLRAISGSVVGTDPFSVSP